MNKSFTVNIKIRFLSPFAYSFDYGSKEYQNDRLRELIQFLVVLSVNLTKIYNFKEFILYLKDIFRQSWYTWLSNIERGPFVMCYIYCWCLHGIVRWHFCLSNSKIKWSADLHSEFRSSWYVHIGVLQVLIITWLVPNIPFFVYTYVMIRFVILDIGL